MHPPATPPDNNPSNDFFIALPVKYLNYCEKIGTAIWLYMWCLDKTTAEYLIQIPGQRVGTVNYERPVRDGDLAKFFGCDTKTIHNWRSTLQSEGMIAAKFNGRGYLYAVIDSRKRNLKRAKDGPLPDWIKVPAFETCEAL